MGKKTIGGQALLKLWLRGQLVKGCLDSGNGNSGIVERWNGGMDFFLAHFVCLFLY